jgi:6-methylsalicylate decarboxylase
MTSTTSTTNRVLPDGRIDVHAHHVPRVIVDTANRTGFTFPDGRTAWPEWSVEAHLEHMDRLGIAVSLLSLSSPGSHWGDDAVARTLSRSVNEAAANVIRDQPARFGAFADLPLPDVEGALEELEYCLDTLRFDGVCLLTNYQDAYLGDPRFDPIFDELNRREATVFVHPHTPGCGAEILLGHPPAMIEFPFDTTRAITNLALSRTLDRCPSIRFILPHAGGTLPFLTARISMVAARLDPPLSESFETYLRRMYYDTGLSASAHHFASLLQIVDSTRILYGTDYPWASQHVPTNSPETLANNPLLTTEDLQRIGRHNALKLFPRLKSLLH